MGRIHVPPLSDLGLALRNGLGIETFVETGTYQGSATRWAATHFRRVVTVEVSPDYQRAARAQLSDFDNIEFVLGDSGTAMPGIVDRLTGPAVFWLDAHAGGGHFGSEDVCPLLAELQAIVSSSHPHVILVDDARAFIAPPPPPFDASRWPSLDEIFEVLQSHSRHHVVLSNDCLICVHHSARSIVKDYILRVRPNI